MFARKKDSAVITEKEPVFEARYLGNVETFSASGKGCAIIPVRNLWENSQSERHLKKVLVAMSSSGIVLKENKKDEGKKFGIENITFCNADKSANDRIFCWIWKVPGVPRLECHAVLCRSRATAQAMALVLSRAFQVAYRDWKANKGRQIRQLKTTHLKEKHDEELEVQGEAQDWGGSRDMNGRQVSGEKTTTDVSENGEVCQKSEEGQAENGQLEKRRASSTSNTSGFASSVILDPDEEEMMQADARVQALVGGEAGVRDHGSE